MSQKITDLRALNQGQSVPELETAHRAIEKQFEQAALLASQLSATMSDFTQEQQDLQKIMHEETEWLNDIKDVLSRCDDITGDDPAIIRRVGDCKVCGSCRQNCILLLK